jgi:hypothetical protein
VSHGAHLLTQPKELIGYVRTGAENFDVVHLGGSAYRVAGWMTPNTGPCPQGFRAWNQPLLAGAEDRGPSCAAYRLLASRCGRSVREVSLSLIAYLPRVSFRHTPVAGNCTDERLDAGRIGRFQLFSSLTRAGSGADETRRRGPFEHEVREVTSAASWPRLVLTKRGGWSRSAHYVSERPARSLTDGMTGRCGWTDAQRTAARAVRS